MFVQNVSLLATACLLESARVRGLRRVHRSKCGSCSTLNLIDLRYQNASGSLNRSGLSIRPSAAFARRSWEVPTTSITHLRMCPAFAINSAVTQCSSRNSIASTRAPSSCERTKFIRLEVVKCHSNIPPGRSGTRANLVHGGPAWSDQECECGSR